MKNKLLLNVTKKNNENDMQQKMVIVSPARFSVGDI